MHIASHPNQPNWRERVPWMLSILLLIGVGIWFIPSRAIVTYRGKDVSAWFDMASGKTKYWELAKESDPRSGYEAFLAFRNIGVAAIPFLIDKAKSERPVFQRLYANSLKRLPPVVRRKLPKVFGDSYYAERRADAIRLLLIIATDGRSSVVERFGPYWSSVITTIKESLDDRSPVVRAAAADFIWRTDSAQFFLPDLIRMTNDSDRKAQGAALLALKSLGPAASNAIPRFCSIAASEDLDSAIRGLALESLGNMGRLAGHAAPAISKLVENDDTQVREDAAAALARIGVTPSNAKNNLLKLLGMDSPRAQTAALLALWNLDPQSVECQSGIHCQLRTNLFENKLFMLDFLQSCGSEASIFLPSVRMAFGDQEEIIRNAATNAIKSISGQKP